MSVPRIHHRVPQLYQRGFARRRGKSWQVRVIDRATGAGGLRNVNRTFAERDWNTLVDAEGNPDPAAVEKAFSAAIEEPVAPVLEVLHEDRFPLPQPQQEYMAMFMSAQLVRGRFPRENLSNFIVDLHRTVMKAKVAHYPDEKWEEEVGFVPSPELKHRLFHSEDHFDLKPTTAHLLETQLASVEGIAALLCQRRWTLVRFDDPCLFTGEEPFIHINPHGESFGYGVTTAEQMYLPISARRALLLSQPWTSWPETVVSGTRELAVRLNWAMLSYPTNEQLLLDPDVPGHPLPGVALLARPAPSPWPPDREAAEGPVWLQLLTEERVAA